jgi:hypothetical protein
MSNSNYLSAVSDVFLQRRGSTLHLSPLDWTVIEKWQTDGIPLFIVVRAVNDVFDKIEMKPKQLQPQIKSIAYCAEEIVSAFENWLELQIGK